MNNLDLHARRCTATSWKGDPASSLAPKGRCKKLATHDGPHRDENGNNFEGSGTDSKVVVLR